MKPVSPVIPHENLKEIIVAENQDEYQNLPVAYCGPPNEGVAVCRWELSDRDIELIRSTKSIWCYIWTFGKPFNPMLLQVDIPTLEIEMEERENE